MSDVMKDGHRYHEQKRDQIGPSKKKNTPPLQGTWSSCCRNSNETIKDAYSCFYGCLTRESQALSTWDRELGIGIERK
jgi:hypothetical protein